MLYDLMKNRRSVRRFQAREIEKEKIDVILKSALTAPSSRDRKPAEFIAITDAEVLRKLALVRQTSSVFLSGAPLGIIVIADKNASDLWIEDATIAATFVQLAAQSLELVSCWIHIRDRMNNEVMTADEYVRRLLNVPDNYSVECMIAIGYPAESKEPHDEEKLDKGKLHYERF